MWLLPVALAPRTKRSAQALSVAELGRFSDVTQCFHTWDGVHTGPLQTGKREQSSSRKVLIFGPAETQRHAHTRIQKAFLLAQASCRFLCKVPLGWLLSLCSCLSSSLRALFPQGPLIPKAYVRPSLFLGATQPGPKNGAERVRGLIKTEFLFREPCFITMAWFVPCSRNGH